MLEGTKGQSLLQKNADEQETFSTFTPSNLPNHHNIPFPQPQAIASAGSFAENRLVLALSMEGFVSLLTEDASAQAFRSVITDGIPGCDFATGRLTATCIPFFVAHLIQLVFSLLGLFFLLNVMYAGYEIAMGAATGGGRESGMRRLQWAIIGFAVSVGSFLILDLAITVFIG